MKLLTVDTIDEARKKIADRAKLWPRKTESISLDQALGCILAEDVYADNDIPSFRRSTVDGYAVIAADTAGAGESIPVFLKQTGSVLMGKPADFSIQSGECGYVPTGGMLPGGADAVVMIEYSESLSNGKPLSVGKHAGEVVALNDTVAPGTGTVEVGEDLRKGKLLLGRGTFLRPQEIGALAAAGITNLFTFSPLVLGLISTGDELVSPEQTPAPGEIRDVNTYALKALAVKHGYRVISVQVLPDDEQLLEAAVLELLPLTDIVVISGGSSQGEKDLTERIINRAATPGVFTHGLAVKPGKPTILGWDEKTKTLFAGLPGHPVSAMMVFELLFGNDQLVMSDEQRKMKKEFPVPARISCNVFGAPGKTVCQPVVLTFKEGGYFAEPVFGKSGMIVTLTHADGYIIIDQNKEGLKKDEPVLVHLF